MSLTGPELDLMARELASLAGARIQKITAPSAQAAALELRRPGQSAVVLFDTAPGAARVGVVPRRPAAPERPVGLQGLLRAHLGGARLDEVTADPLRRLLALRFSTGKGERSLVLEIASAAGALVLLDGQGRVLGGVLDAGPDRRLVPGKPWTPPPIPPGQPPATRFAPVVGADWPLSEAVREHYESVSTRRRDDGRRVQLAAQLRRQLQRARRTVEKVRQDKARIDEAESHRLRGDLLKPALGQLTRGATEAVVTEWREEGPIEVRVPLLPQLSPRENMERYYHLHRRLSRSAGLVESRLAHLEQEAARLAGLLAQLEGDSVSPGQLDEIESTLTRRPASVEQAAKVVARQPYRQYLSATQRRIWVGRGAKDNDALTFRHARGNDLWMHARGVPGSHVVVPGNPPDQETLLDAATLAAHFSGARGEQVSEIAAVARKHVQKPKGAPTGAVRYSQERTVVLRLEPERLQRLLATEGMSPS